VRLDLGPVLGGDERAGLGRVVRPWPSRIRPRAADLLDEPVVDRVLDDRPAAGEQTWPEWVKAAVSALSTAVSKSASSNTMFGLLPPISSATCLRLTAAPGRSAGRHRAAGQRDEVDVRAVGERLADPSAPTEHEVDDAAGTAGLDHSIVRWIAVNA
jgi:hypothetical protein